MIFFSVLILISKVAQKRKVVVKNDCVFKMKDELAFGHLKNIKINQILISEAFQQTVVSNDI